MSAIASNDELWYFVPSHICFGEYAVHYGQKKITQKVLVRSSIHYEAAPVELTSFRLPCFGISGATAFENAGPDSTFVVTIAFDIPPPEGLLLDGEFHSNFQDQLHVRHAVSGAIMASLSVKAIWDLTPHHSASFYPPALPSCTTSSHAESIRPSQIVRPIGSDTAKHAPAATSSCGMGMIRPKYDEAEDSFYRSLLAGKISGEAKSVDCSSVPSVSFPKNSRINFSSEEAAFYSQVIAGVKHPSQEVKQTKPVKSVVQLDGDDVIIIDGIKYDTWGNIIPDDVDVQSQCVQDSDAKEPSADFLAAKKKLPQLGPTILRGSNVPSTMTATAIARQQGNRYLDILDGTAHADVRDSDHLPESHSKRPGKKNGVGGLQVPASSTQGLLGGIKPTTSSVQHSNQPKLSASASTFQKNKKFSSGQTIASSLSTEDDFNDAWDAL